MGEEGPGEGEDEAEPLPAQVVLGPREFLAVLDAALHEQQVSSLLKEALGELPDQLLVPLGPDVEGRVLVAQLSFLSADEEPPILQYYVGLPFGLSVPVPADLGEVVLLVNAAIPIGAFGLITEEAILYFRHNALLPLRPVDLGAAAYGLGLLERLLALFVPVLRLAAGGASLAACRAALEVAIALDDDSAPG